MTRPFKYPWHDLDVGESFFVPNPPKQADGRTAPFVAAPNRRYKPKRFSSKQENNGIRVTRIK